MESSQLVCHMLLQEHRRHTFIYYYIEVFRLLVGEFIIRIPKYLKQLIPNTIACNSIYYYYYLLEH